MYCIDPGIGVVSNPTGFVRAGIHDPSNAWSKLNCMKQIDESLRQPLLKN